jgi:hypothetical protein
MVAEKPERGHFNQKPRRKADFIKPINLLRSPMPFHESERSLSPQPLSYVTLASWKKKPRRQGLRTGLRRLIHRGNGTEYDT